MDQMATAVVLEYMTRMGVPPDVVTLAQATLPWEIYEIGNAEARRIGVDNSEISFSALTVRAMNDGAVAEVESSNGAVVARLYCVSGSREPHLAFIFRHEEADDDVISGYRDFTEDLSFEVSDGGEKKVFRAHRVAFGSSRPNAGGMVVAMSYAFPEEAAPHLRSADTVQVEFDWEASRVELSYHAALSAAFDGDRRLIDLVMRNCIRGS